MTIMEKSRLHGIHFLSQSGNIVGIIGHIRNNKKWPADHCNHVSHCFYLVPGARIELAQPQGSRDFKSLASTSSATQAQCSIMEETVRLILFLIWHVKDLI